MSLERGHRILIFLILWSFQYCVSNIGCKTSCNMFESVLVGVYVFNVVHSEASDWNIWMSTTQRPKNMLFTNRQIRSSFGGNEWIILPWIHYTQTPPGKLVLLGPKCIWFLDAIWAQTNPKNNSIIFVRLLFLEFFKGEVCLPYGFLWFLKVFVVRFPCSKTQPGFPGQGDLKKALETARWGGKMHRESPGLINVNKRFRDSTTHQHLQRGAN